MKNAERVNDSDRMLITRMEARVAEHLAAANAVQVFVQNHLAAVYELKPGDSIGDDGMIARQSQDKAPEPEYGVTVS